MSVSANQLIKRQAGCRLAYLVEEATRLYQGTLVFLNAAGYADDDTASGVNRFGGIAIGEVDNSSGADGDLSVECWGEGVFELTGTGFTQASVGRAAYASDNYTVTAAPSAAGVRIGTIVEYVSSTKVRVEIDVDGVVGHKVQTHTAAKTITVAENGSFFSTVGASGTVTFTLPPAVPGLRFGFRVGAAQELRIDPDGTETISLPSTGVAGAAGKYLTADAAGETVQLVCVVAGTWSVFGHTGTWTAEP
jgi:hypothetical protein